MANSRYVASLSTEELQTFREKLHAIQQGRCYICRNPVDLQLHEGAIEIDHIEPLAVGGREDQTSPAEGEEKDEQQNAGGQLTRPRGPEGHQLFFLRLAPPAGESRSFRSVSSHGNLLTVLRLGWTLLGDWKREPAGPRMWGRASARLGLGRVRRPCRLNPGGGVLARRRGTGLCGLLRRPPFGPPEDRNGQQRQPPITACMMRPRVF